MQEVKAGGQGDTGDQDAAADVSQRQSEDHQAWAGAETSELPIPCRHTGGAEHHWMSSFTTEPPTRMSLNLAQGRKEEGILKWLVVGLILLDFRAIGTK